MAMAAQPISHLYGKVGLNPEQIWLTVAAGLIPAAVFGHLLHMGAVSPKPKPVIVGIDPSKPEGVTATPKADVLDKLMKEAGHGIPVSEFLAARSVRPGLGLSEYASEFTYGQSDTDNWRDSVGTVPDTDSSGQPDMATWTGQPDTDKDNRAGQDVRTEDLHELSEPPVVRPSNVRSIKKPTLSADVRAYLSEHPDAKDDDLAAAMAVKWPKAKWDSVRKARDRFKENQENTGS
jgi:hypothetical protein